MKIDTDTIQKIADLAHIELTADEKEKYQVDLSRILDLVEEMNQVETTNIQPLTNCLEHTQRLREDAITEKNERETLQAGAPQVDETGYYLVPPVIGEGE